MKLKDRRPHTYGQIVERIEFLEALKVLTDNEGPLVVENDLILAIVNDTFDLATADCERVDPAHVRWLADLYESYGAWVAVAYVAIKRGTQPMRMILNNTDYQRAFAAVSEVFS
ncbi:MAG: hypothetical protein E6Q97_12330 [Desulfurellales bacterium]|nr:MAG: hypothetical protein E6Q97_12330 [Desulfurellales bacterium]